MHDLVADLLPDGAELVDLGVQRLRDLGRPERVSQLIHPHLAADFPPLRSLDVLRHNLPSQLSTFVGRTEELALTRKLLGTTRLLTLTGSGGCGKTRLALQVVADVADQFPDGVWLCDLGAISDAAYVVAAIATVLGVKESTGAALVDEVARQARQQRCLILLDNCEHLIEECASVVAALLRACPSLLVLATSREPLGVEGELSWRVPSLSLPPEASSTKPITRLPRSDAVALFVARARHARPNFVLDDRTGPIVHEICRRLDGIPLAIELAAARVRLLPVDKIADGLDDRFRLLGSGPRTAMPRQQTLEASVSWSYNLLAAHERTLLSRLSVFAGDFGLDAAEAVCSGGDVDPYAVLDVLLSLVDRSLVVADEDTSRYRLLETIKQFAWDRLVDAGQDIELRDCHLAFYAQRSRSALALRSANRIAFFADVHRDYDNVREALVWGATPGRVTEGLHLAAPLFFYWQLRGRHTEGRRLLDDLVAASEGEEPALRVWSVFGAGVMATYAGDVMAAMRLLNQALSTAEVVGDLRINAGCRMILAQTKGLLYGAAATLDDADAAVTVARRADDGMFLAGALWVAGGLHMTTDLDRALPLLQEAHDVAVASGFPSWYSLRDLAALAATRGEFREAERLLRRALALGDDEVGDRNQRLEVMGNLELLLVARGAPSEFRALLDDEWLSIESTGSFNGIIAVGQVLFHLTVLEGDIDRAIVMAEHLTAMTRPTGSRVGLFTRLSMLATALLEADRGEEARAAFDEARVIGGQIGLNETPILLAMDALIALRADDFETAETLNLDALVKIPSGHHEFASRCLANLALSWVGLGRYVDAVRLLSAIDAFYSPEGIVRRHNPWTGKRLDAGKAEAKSALGEAAFEGAWTDGQRLSIDDAVAYAIRGRGRRRRPSTGWESLTRTELQVAGLVAEGLPNAQIAERLFVSPKTVATHLSHVFAKLGVKSRTELAVIASQSR
ncbi:MAG TPA: LuxR C-terminal-related transcriptional regulator [Acidimicrobiales bacterium]|nr:LuxR C-terminal-related transcriptional regulator [Acidimicrobiales bacterium]